MDGQISIFDCLVEDTKEKPPIGTRIIFNFMGKRYPAVVKSHCGGNERWFYIEFTGRQPSDDNPAINPSGGWHVSTRGRGIDWRVEQ